MSKVQSILSELTTLSDEELLKVQAAVGHLSPSKKGKASKAVDEVFPCIRDALQKRGVQVPHLGIVSKHRCYPTLVEGSEHVREYVKRFQPKDGIERLAATNICIEAVLEWISECNLPFTLRIVVQQLKNVGIAMEEQFPSYNASGLLPMLLRGFPKRKPL